MCLAHAVRCTSLINWLRGTFSLVVLVIVLGVADDGSRLEFMILPHSSVIWSVKSGRVTRLSFFRMVPLPMVVVAIDADEPDDVSVLLLLLLLSDDDDGDDNSGIGVAGRNFSPESNMVSALPLSGVAEIGRKNFAESSVKCILVLHSAIGVVIVVDVIVVNGWLLSNIGLLEYGLRLNTGDCDKFPRLDGELSKFKLLLLLLLLLLTLALVLVLQFIAVVWTFPLSIWLKNVLFGVFIILLLLLKPKLRFCNRFNKSWFDWNKSPGMKLLGSFVLLLLLVVLLLLLVLMLVLVLLKLLLLTMLLRFGTELNTLLTLFKLLPKFWNCCKFWLCWFKPLNCWLSCVNCWLIVPKLFSCWFMVAMLLLFGVIGVITNDFRIGEPLSPGWSDENRVTGDWNRMENEFVNCISICFLSWFLYFLSTWFHNTFMIWHAYIVILMTLVSILKLKTE